MFAVAVGSALCLVACSAPATGVVAPAGSAATALDANSTSVARNLALLDTYCWRLELNKNTDYTVLAKASEGSVSDASIYESGASWSEVLQKAVDAMEADMATHGITPDEARANNRGSSFTEPQIKELQDRYRAIDAKAWYFKAVKTQGWTMTSKADIGGIASVTAMGQGDTLLAALDDSLRNLDDEIVKRRK